MKIHKIKNVKFKQMDAENLNYRHKKSDDKVDEFRNFIRETEKVWKEYGLIYNATKDFTEDLEKHYSSA